jgi:hypothetical protein
MIVAWQFTAWDKAKKSPSRRDGMIRLAVTFGRPTSADKRWIRITPYASGTERFS